RSAKWARRRPAQAALLALAVATAMLGAVGVAGAFGLAGLLALSVVAMIGAAAGTWVFVTRLRQERDAADDARRQAEQDQKCANEQRALAEERELRARRYL